MYGNWVFIVSFGVLSFFERGFRKENEVEFLGRKKDKTNWDSKKNNIIWFTIIEAQESKNRIFREEMRFKIQNKADKLKVGGIWKKH